MKKLEVIVREKLESRNQNEFGITLIALIVTIIVLLILAGVSIATLTGNNGLLTKTQQAKTQTEEETLEEKIKLLATEAIINQYTGESEETTAEKLQNDLNEQGENVLVVQWDKYIIFDLDENKEYRVMSDGNTEYWGESTMGQTLLNTKTANADQLDQDNGTSNLIGIDNDGNTVNMLLWEKTLIDDSSLGKVGTYGLNDKNGLDATGKLGRSAGYIGGYTEDGEIIGTVPAYISEDGGNTYVSVTSMVHTFYDCANLVIAPEISNTVTDMSICFYQSDNLTTAPNEIPNSVINMQYTFSNCNKLNKIPTLLGNNIKDMTYTFSDTVISEFNVVLPNSITKMKGTFSGCTELKTGPNIIPNNVTDMTFTFRNCRSLTTSPNIIPDNVTDMSGTFYMCTSLVNGPATVSNNVTSMQSTFYECTSLTTLPSTIPSSVTNMFQTFGGCSNLQGEIEINANIDESIVYEWNGTQYKGYDETFSNAATESSGIVIKNTSTCRKEVLNAWVSGNTNVSLVE